MNNFIDFIFTTIAAMFVFALALLPVAVVTLLFVMAFRLF